MPDAPASIAVKIQIVAAIKASEPFHFVFHRMNGLCP